MSKKSIIAKFKEHVLDHETALAVLISHLKGKEPYEGWAKEQDAKFLKAFTELLDEYAEEEVREATREQMELDAACCDISKRHNGKLSDETIEILDSAINIIKSQFEHRLKYPSDQPNPPTK